MHVVVITPDIVGTRMAGPGMRAYHFARHISPVADTVLVARFDNLKPTSLTFRPAEYGSGEASRLLRSASIVIGQPIPDVLSLSSPEQIRVFDLFDPVVLELDELYGPTPTLRQRFHRYREWRRLTAALEQGDVLIAATPQQRDFYTGVRRLTGPIDHEWLTRWVDVPFGAERPPQIESRVDDPPLILWGGGLWKWLDPHLAIEAVEIVNSRGVACRMTMFGGPRPLHAAAHARELESVRARAAASRYVDFHDEWVPHAERWRWWGRAKIAIMLHRRTAEAEYSIRTRMFDAIAAHVPVVASEGGYAAGVTRERNLGLVAAAGDASSVADAIITLLKDDDLYRRSVSNLRELSREMSWEVVTRPLVEVIRSWQK